jgi:hypothetical protein
LLLESPQSASHADTARQAACGCGRRIALPAFAQPEGALEVLPDRRCQALDLLGRELCRRLERRQPRAEEDLVRVGASDAGDRALVAEERMELAALSPKDLAERRGVEIERIRAQVGELGLQRLRCEEPDPARASFPPPSARPRRRW